MRSHPWKSFALAATTLLTLAACSNGTSPGADCVAPTPYALGVRVEGKMTSEDCVDEDGGRVDVFQLSFGAQTNFLLTFTPSGFAAHGGIFTGNPTATNVTPQPILETDDGSKVGFRAFLPPGTYYAAVGATSGRGTYVLESAEAASNDCLYPNFTAPGAAFAGTVIQGDCLGGNAQVHQDIYSVYLVSGRAYTVNVTLDFSSATVRQGAVLLRRGDANSASLRSYETTGAPVSFSYTPTTSGYYGVHVLSEQPQPFRAVGYSLSIK